MVAVTLAFGMGQPALMEAVGDAVSDDVRGVALGVATLFFLVGGGIGSAVVGGLGSALGMPYALLLIAVLPVAGIVGLAPQLRVAPQPRVLDCPAPVRRDPSRAGMVGDVTGTKRNIWHPERVI